jgi:hypothetical protein
MKASSMPRKGTKSAASRNRHHGAAARRPQAGDPAKHDPDAPADPLTPEERVDFGLVRDLRKLAERWSAAHATHDKTPRSLAFCNIGDALHGLVALSTDYESPKGERMAEAAFALGTAWCSDKVSVPAGINVADIREAHTYLVEKVEDARSAFIRAWVAAEQMYRAGRKGLLVSQDLVDDVRAAAAHFHEALSIISTDLDTIDRVISPPEIKPAAPPR